MANAGGADLHGPLHHLIHTAEPVEKRASRMGVEIDANFMVFFLKWETLYPPIVYHSEYGAFRSGLGTATDERLLQVFQARRLGLVGGSRLLLGLDIGVGARGDLCRRLFLGFRLVIIDRDVRRWGRPARGMARL